MTYRELHKAILDFSEEQLDMDVTVYDGGRGEYFGDGILGETTVTDVLDNGHPVIIFDLDEDGSLSDFADIKLI